MKKTVLYLSVMFLVILAAACRTDETYKQGGGSADPGDIQLALTGRVGTVVDANLSEYVKSLNLMLFRQNAAGEFVLFRSVVLDKEQLQALTDADEPESGFTTPKEFIFEAVPISTYRIVGLGNALDSVGNALPNVALQGLQTGASMQQILLSIVREQQASRLFFGMTGNVQVGVDDISKIELRMSRKISMFALTLEKIPDVVNRIDMEIGNTYGSFAMDGNFTPGSATTIFAFNSYAQQVNDSITLAYITLPTVAGDSSTFLTTFYLQSGIKQNVTLPKYVLKPNTITKLTATIDVDQPGGVWKVNLDLSVSVNVEWNVDQEPPITI